MITRMSACNFDPETTDLRTLFRGQVERCADGLAYAFLGNDLEPAHVLTFEELGEVAEAISSRLRSLTRPGDRVLLAFSNEPEALQLFWGCLLAGVVPVPAPAPEARNPKASESRLSGMARDAGVALALARSDLIEAARAQVADVHWIDLMGLLDTPVEPARSDTSGTREQIGHPDDVAYLQYTSGSTSAPRGVEITHSNVLAQCRAFGQHAQSGRSRGLVWLPWFHDYGLVQGVILPLMLGCTSYLMPTLSFLLRPLRWLEAIDKHQVTHSGAPDFAFAACVQALNRTPGWTARLDSLQLVTCGAEPVRATTLDAFTNAFVPFGFKPEVLAPSYGLAEAVLAVTVHDARTPPLTGTFDASRMDRLEVLRVADDASGARRLVGCGPALPSFEVSIVDPDTATPCAPDRIGEIWVAGPSVARGYRGQPDASLATFGASLTADGNQGKTYLRTGDLGFIHQGELFVAGRRKDLIIVNGRNLHPQDLERTAESAHSGVRPGGVFAVAVDSGRRESVVLLVECSRRHSPEVARDLIDAVGKLVAVEHQVELQDVVLLRAGTLPRTSSGKPQRHAARRLYLQGTLEPLRIAVQPAPPAVLAPDETADAELMDKLLGLWGEVLGVSVVEPDANFFDLGGDSLLATQLVSRLRARFGIDLPISALFETPTVRGLAKLLALAPASAQETLTLVDDMVPDATAPRPPGSVVPLSFSQERMWFMHELAPDRGAYNIPLALRFRGAFDTSVMQAALARVVQRHEVLRTRFITTPEGVIGEVVAAQHPAIEEVRLGPADISPSDTALHLYLAQATLAPFRLDQCPLLRAQAIRLSEDEVVLLIVMHHIVGDQWSFAELGRELAAHYNAIQQGGEATLPPLPFQVADHARWHRGWFDGERHARERDHWLRRLDGLEPMALNEDFPRPRGQSFRGSTVRLPLAREDISALRQLGASHGASLSMVLIAALKVMLQRHTGMSDIAIGVPIANRHHLTSEHLIGTFVNTLVFRTDLAGDPDFQTVLSRVRAVSLDAFAHQDMPFELLVREMGGRPDASRQPLFNVMFNMVNSQARDCHFDGLEWTRLDFDRQSTQFDLTVVADLLYDQAIVIEYATDLFSRETVQRMAEHLESILHAAVRSPSERVSTFPLMRDDERLRLDAWSTGPSEPLPASTVGEWVGAGARMAPDHPAVVFGTAILTHRELDAATNKLARHLRQRGISRGDRVGLCLPRGTDLLVAMLAVIKSGAAYVPLDPGHPPQRIGHQIDDAGLSLLITTATIAVKLSPGPVVTLLMDEESQEVAAESDEPLDSDRHHDAGPEDPAYVIYTSGSTGRPKGVVVPHRAVVNLLSSMATRPGLTNTDRLLAITTPSFDIAVLELLLPLGVGATVVMASDAQATDGRALADLVAREHITVLQATPSRWHLLIDSGWAGNPSLKALVGGEPLTRSLASQLQARCREVWNMYGPTETTVWSSCWQLPSDPTQPISLGRPVANTTILVLDGHLQPCPIGVAGEICIGGMGLALGYHQRDELTAERFVVAPEGVAPGDGRLYRTGDRGRWRHDGSLEHGGRLDDQVKLRGFRVELGEIEAHLLTHTGVARAVVALHDDGTGSPRLVAYVVPHNVMPAPEQLRQHLRHWLPDPMVPAQFVEMATLPALPNGKTNRKALPAPPGLASRSPEPRVAPRDAIEEAIWSAWRDTLQIDDFGIHDNFFDLGGHSIQAVGVVTRIEKALLRPCSLALLFEHPTVADLAAVMAKPTAAGTVDKTLTVLQHLGQGPTLFLLAGAEMYRPLAQRLGPEVPVIGVFSQTEIDLLQRSPDSVPPKVSVDTLAGEYLELIRSVQPQGPYFLGGFSIGGVLAYEVAQRLQQQGESLGLLILFDSMLPGRGWQHVLAGVRRRLRMLRQHGASHLRHILQVYRLQRSQRNQPGGRRNQAYVQAIRSYRARPGDMAVLFLQAGDDASTAPAYGWQSLVPALTVVRVPGRHMDILEPPNVDELSGHVRAHLAATHPAWPVAGSANRVDADSNHRH
ncbi:amino acid adenylation domain-containing protein [Hydrogenophaga sp. XSHU_21]